MELKKNKEGKYVVWEFLYCSMIYESDYGTLSIHATEEGANKAMEIHREFARHEWQKLYAEEISNGEEPYCKFGEFEAWTVRECEIKD